MRTPNRLQQAHKRCRTGCVGVCLRAKTVQARSGLRTRFYFQALVGSATGRKRWLMFRIDTLGRQEAFRRAVRARAEYETAVRALQAQGRDGSPSRSQNVRGQHGDRRAS